MGRHNDIKSRPLPIEMPAKLAFAIADKVQSGVLLLDEEFLAGDRRFQGNCDKLLRARHGKPAAVIVTTHNTTFVSQICTSAVWPDHGSIREVCDPPPVAGRYLACAAPSAAKAIEENAWREL